MAVTVQMQFESAVTETYQKAFVWFDMIRGFLSAFGDMPFWNSLAFCVLLPYISSFSCGDMFGIRVKTGHSAITQPWQRAVSAATVPVA